MPGGSYELKPAGDDSKATEKLPGTQNEESSDFWLGKRNLIGFWLLGLCNNFAYVVMLSAAHDILKDETSTNTTNITTTAVPSTKPTVASTLNYTETTTPENSTECVGSEYLECNKIGTGAILLADILPTLVIKLTAPFYLQKVGYRLKVSVVVLFALASFLIVGFSNVVWLSILGVVCASISAGLGEITFLSLSTFFNRNVVSTWSSGTGGAGVAGSLGYAGLTQVVSPRTTVFILTSVPVLLGISYFWILKRPPPATHELIVTTGASDQSVLIKEPEPTLKDKLLLIVPLLKYMIPLATVYYGEYFINQGLHELLYFNCQWLTKAEQYRWLQVDYQIGVFISRSSVNIIQIRPLWILPILQLANLSVLLTQVFYRYIPNMWIIFAIVLFEGLLGGSAYVNTFFRITKEVAPEHREYSMGVASVGDSIGIAVAGACAIPSHNSICSRNLKM